MEGTCRSTAKSLEKLRHAPVSNVFYVAALVMFVREKREIGAYRITASSRHGGREGRRDVDYDDE